MPFDTEKAERGVAFFERLRHTKGKWAGVPFQLAPYQDRVIRDVFGTVNKDGTRQYRTVYIEVPRKNGKSELGGGFALKLLAADGEPGPEVYGAAFSRDQASIVFRVASTMVKSAPFLSQQLRVVDSTKRITFPKMNGFYRAIPGEVEQAHGFNMNGGVFDEFHTQKTRFLYDALATSVGAREQPLLVIITTAGYDRESICFELHEYAEAILRGAIADPTFYPCVFSAGEDEDWTDEDVWHRANPALGLFRNIDEMRALCERAKQVPALENTFRQLYLNQWTKQSNRWISMDLWDRNAGDAINEDDLEGRGCYGFLDLSAVSDLTAWVMIFPREGDPDKIDVLPRFWVPEVRLTDPLNRWRSQYVDWHRRGYLKTTPGDAIDYGFIRQQVIADASRFGLQRMNVDRLFQGAQLGMELAEEIGEDRVFAMGMGFASFASPMAEFERRLLGSKINHGGNPVLRWMADSLAVKKDPAGNLKPDKASSQGKIDGIVGIVGALDAQMRTVEEPAFEMVVA